MDGINQPNSFEVKNLENTETPKKKLGLISLFSKKNLPKTLIIVFVVLILMFIGAILWGQNSFSKSKVSINVEISKDIASGDEVEFKIKYENNNRVNLNDANLIIAYPTGTFDINGKELFQEARNIGTINRKSNGEETFKARFVGQKGDIKNLSIKLDYLPQNISSRFENSSSARIEINSTLIEINIEGSEKAVNGQDVNYVIEYENKSEQDFFNLRIEIDYSSDFELKESNPEPINGVWEIESLEVGEKGIIDLIGVLQGLEMENKILKTTIGKQENGKFIQYSQAEFVTQISPSPILLNIKARNHDDDCILNIGQSISYDVEFKNNTDVALRELILKVYLDSRAFDFKTVENNKGFFDSRDNSIIWSGADVSELNLLEPNQSGKLSFSINLMRSIPIFNNNDKNFELIAISEIQTLTIPEKFSVSELRFTDKLTCKLNSTLDLITEVYYYEPEAGIINQGPIPPSVGQLTNYTVHWQIVNTSNDIENVRVSAFLPQGIEWSNFYLNDNSNTNVQYNERTKEVVWEIPYISSGTGIFKEWYELVFQIGLRPSVNQIATMPILINESSIEGKDNFTQNILKDFTPAVSTSLPDDPMTSSEDGKVKE
ncbi:hypothetical protein KJ684_00800 [Patescibacteria group bacterium]|nr:hypothetical protein [Patescibacteria group bacterium]